MKALNLQKERDSLANLGEEAVGQSVSLGVDQAKATLLGKKILKQIQNSVWWVSVGEYKDALEHIKLTSNYLKDYIKEVKKLNSI